jgi:hypothetical protein
MRAASDCLHRPLRYPSHGAARERTADDDAIGGFRSPRMFRLLPPCPDKRSGRSRSIAPNLKSESGTFVYEDENEAGCSHNDTFQVVHYDEITWQL